MNDTSKAVFLSYASQDAAAVLRLAEALRSAGVEVWFDQNELVGGDAWDAKIRGQIANCALFVPVISANTQARREGYFRIEWKLAAQRTHAMADGTPFLLPVVIDATRDAEALVPGEFKGVQWMRLAIDGERPGTVGVTAFCARVGKLLGSSAVLESALATPEHGLKHRATPETRRRVPVAAWVGAIVAVAAAVGVFVLRPKPETRAEVRPPVAEKTAPAAGENSVAVLPFANLSGDAAQEYFSDGLTEEILNTLAREPDLRVPGRTSSFSFKGKNVAAAEIARALNVSRLVEGSVRKAGNRVRISVSLTRGSDGFSEDLGTFTEELADIFALQDKVARVVVEKLTQRAAPVRPAVALTKNAEAYDLFLRAQQVFFRGDRGGFQEAIALAEAAVALDPGYASAVFTLAAGHCNIVRMIRNSSDPKTLVWHAAEARRWAEVAAKLDPAGLGLSAQAIYHLGVRRDYPRSLAQADLALQGRPNDIAAYTFRAWSLHELGRTAEALESFRAATIGDPLNPFSLGNEAWAATLLRRTGEAAAALNRAEAGAGKQDSEWRGRFVLTGELPRSAAGFNPSDRALWLWRSRRFAELAELAAQESTGADAPAARFQWRLRQHDALRRLGRTGEAEGVARELPVIAQAIEELPDLGPPVLPGLHASALVRVGRVAEGLAAAGRHLEAATPDRYAAERWRRETELAELHAYLGDPAACVALLAKLLRVPSGLTVPMLKVDPTWDPVRDDPAFQALLADPKNSAPL